MPPAGRGAGGVPSAGQARGCRLTVGLAGRRFIGNNGRKHSKSAALNKVAVGGVYMKICFKLGEKSDSSFCKTLLRMSIFHSTVFS